SLRGGKPGSRRGSILLTVLVVVLLLTLGIYQFAELMLVERQAAELAARETEARVFADSGVEYVSALLMQRAELREENLYHDPEVFGGVLMRDAAAARGRGRFSVVAAVETDATAQQIRFGLQDESGRLNLNAIASFDLEEEEEERNLLMQIPAMTHEVADSILDWLDEDTETREFGAESDYYQGLASPYAAKNGPLESLDELLLVRGVTRELLYGEDANRNGLLDPSENDGELLPPWDNADGLLDTGWSAFLTVHSRESNRQSNGAPRIWLNNSTLTELYDELLEQFDEDTARFIVAYRTSGPVDGDEGDGSGGGSGNGSGGGGRNGGGGGRNSGGGGTQGLERLAEGLARGLMGASGSVTRGGVNLAAGGRYNIDSIYDLVGRQVQTEVDGSQTILDSPWPNDPATLQQALPDLIDKLSPSQDPSIPGRINVNQARLEVLLGIPGMTEEAARSIVGAKMIGSGGEPLTDAIASRATTGWLVSDGLIDLETMRTLDKYLTTRGDVLRAQIVGHFDEGGPSVRLEAVFDASEPPVKLLMLRDLSHLGAGYQLQAAPGG
ncbi:MAG: general secretion pathway protein GspK, partial [Planctomycetaceae bacterium]|nr:general secretion pathway protein GspK [Planctomycetaceae bacterium]